MGKRSFKVLLCMMLLCSTLWSVAVLPAGQAAAATATRAASPTVTRTVAATEAPAASVTAAPTATSAVTQAAAPAATSSVPVNGTIMQFFEWNTPKDGGHWNHLAAEAANLSDVGITAIWIPPAYKGHAGIDDVGYGVYDFYDLGEFNQKGTVRTKYGTKAELKSAIDSLHNNNVQVYGDIVVNHMMGGDQSENIKVTQVQGNNRNQTIGEFNTNVYTKYNFDGRNNAYSSFKWDWTDFDGSDDYGKIYRYPGKSWDWEVSTENGNYDYLMGTDLDYDNPAVADEIKKWGVWYVNEMGLDGYRLDAVKHIKFSFMKDFVENARAKTGKELFSVGEYIAGTDELNSYLGKVNQSMSLFDFPLRNNFAAASSSNGGFSMRNLASGTLTGTNPVKSVTFVENHDTQPDRLADAHGAPVLDWFKPLAYAFTLTRQEGYPSVFYGDYYGTRSSSTAGPGTGKIQSLKSKLDPLLKARKDYAYGKQNDYLDNDDLIGWTREGLAAKPNSGLATVMTDRTGGSKTMYVGTSHAGEQWKDITGNFSDKVTIGSNGNGTFKVKDGSVSVWVPDVATPTDQPPTIPTNVEGTATSTTSVALKWAASSDDKGVVKYEIYRDSALIGESTSPAYTDSTVLAGNSYSYTIKAIDTIGQKSAFSTATKVTVGDGGTQDQPPTAPTNVKGTAVGTTTVNLTWSSSTDDKGVVKYEIYRDGTLKGETTGTAYSDNTIANDKTYSYTVRAIDTIGQKSVYSAPAVVKIGNGGQQQEASPFSWDNANVYFVMTDRFNNGNTSNDGAYGRPKADAWGSNVGTFHGGDIKGLTKKLEEGYFTDLGTNAIWITAPWEQMHGWVGGKDGDFAHYGYHGYYGLDFTEMDKSIGTIDEMREFVDLAHSKGIRVVLDVIMNHVAYPTLVDMAEYGYGDRGGLAGNWTPDKNQGQNWHTHNTIMNTNNSSAWASWWGSSWIRANNIAGYDQCGGSDQTQCVGFLPDIKTESTTPTGLPPILKTKFNKETSGYDNWIVPAAKQYRQDLNVAPKDYMIKWLSSWVEEFGVDGFRVDTAKHVQADRWKELKTSASSALAKWRQNNPTKPGANWTDNFWMTGEVYDKGLGRDGTYFDNGFDSLINFSFQNANKSDLEGLFSRYASEFNNDLPNYNMLSYISSHDRNLYNRAGLIDAGTALLLLPGAVQTFYGDETARPFGPTGSDPDQGARSDMNWSGINQSVLSHWQKLGQFRNNHIAVGAGTHKKLADSPYTFSRIYEKDDILDKVVVATGASGTVDVSVSGVFPDGTTVRDAYTKNEVVVSGGKAKFTAGANGVILIENVGVNKKFPVLTASPAGGKFKSETTTVTLSIKNADSGKYTLDGSDPINGTAFTNGTTITIGAGMAINDTKTLKMYAVNENGEGTASYDFTKGDPNAKLEIYFKKPAGWGTPSIYFYGTAPKDNDPTWATAPAMTSAGGDWYVYTFDKAEQATMIFKDSTGKQLPAQNQAGFTRTATGWYDGSTWSDTDPRIITKPTAPSNLAASAKTDKTVTLTWNASTDSSGIAGYDVYRNNIKVGSPSAVTYKDTGLTAETTYTYKVVARSQSGGISDPSNELSVKTNPPEQGTDNTVTVYYKKGYATPYIHYRAEGGTWTAVPGVKMADSEVPGYAVYTIDLGTSSATRAEVAFNNGSGQWDSNNQKNYFFNKGDNTYDAGKVTAGKPEDPKPGNKVTVYYKEGWTNVNIHYRAEGGTWTSLPGVKMENDSLNPGYKKITVDIGTASRLEACFNNGSNVWDSNGQKNYFFNTGDNIYIPGINNAPGQVKLGEKPQGVDTVAPSVPANLAGNLSSGSPKTITLTWGASTDNVGVTDYQITRKSGTSTETFTVNATTFIDSTVKEGTTYKYQVRARDAANNFSANSNEVTIEVPSAGDTIAPTVPTNVKGTATTTSIALEWTASTDNVGVTGYDIYSGSVVAGSVAGTTTSFNVTGLSPNTDYSFTVKARDAANNVSDESAVFRVKTLAVDSSNRLVNPSFETYTGTNGVANSWAKSATSGVTSLFQVVAAPVASGSKAQKLTGSNMANNNAVMVSQLIPVVGGASYTASGQFKVYSLANAKVQLYIDFYNASNTYIAYAKVDYSKVTDSFVPLQLSGKVPAAATSARVYAILRGTEADGAGSFVVDDMKFSSGDPGDTQAPSTPASLASTGSTATSVSLSWTASTDNVDVSGYEIYRNGTKVGTSTTPSFTDTGLTEATSYKYTVKAYDAAGNLSAASNEVTVGTSGGTDTQAPSVPASLISTGKTSTAVSLSWAASTDNVAVGGYDIYRGAVKVGTSTTTTFKDTGLTAETSYTYTVKAFDAANNFSAASAELTVVTLKDIVVIPGGNKPYSTNPSFGKRVSTPITIDGTNNGEWTDDMLIAIDMAGDDPRSLGSNWSMHETPMDLSHLWAAWDNEYLYLAWQYVDVTDIVDPANAGSAGGTPIRSMDMPQTIAFDTIRGAGATNDMWKKNGNKPLWGGLDLPDYQFNIASNMFHSGYISRAVNGLFPVDDAGVNYKTGAAAGITVKFAKGKGYSTLWGVKDADDVNNPSKLVNFMTLGHDPNRDTFYEAKIPLSALGNPDIENEGIGVMLHQGEFSPMDTLPNDPATSDTPGVSESNSPKEWSDIDLLTVPFARIGR
ncbi:alpha-amylase [Paenibacillus zeisoli]|uniref:Alpha-amylase n=1 Tax=Paenibacillus zeisoli TaxID=2496267 RepID=A0A433XQE6_9BACL|nr:alpha-amylase [Paenibacillus zeisoli]RUT36321.1 alpha-amylase [Paenibacillus zeisoli]